APSGARRPRAYGLSRIRANDPCPGPRPGGRSSEKKRRRPAVTPPQCPWNGRGVWIVYRTDRLAIMAIVLALGLSAVGPAAAQVHRHRALHHRRRVSVVRSGYVSAVYVPAARRYPRVVAATQATSSLRIPEGRFSVLFGPERPFRLAELPMRGSDAH